MEADITKIGIPERLALPTNTVIDKNKSYVVLNLTSTLLAMPSRKDEKGVILSDFGRENCYYMPLGEIITGAVVHRLWVNGMIAVFNADDFPEYEVTTNLCGEFDPNPLIQTGFDKKDFSLSQSIGDDKTTMRTHVVDPYKTNAKLSKDFNYGYYKKYQKEGVPPQARNYNPDAFDDDRDFDHEEWLRNAKKGKEEVF